MTAPATQSHEDDVLGKAYDRKLMRRLLVYTRPYRKLMYGAFALLCVEGGVQGVGPLLTRRVIDVAVPARHGGGGGAGSRCRGRDGLHRALLRGAPRRVRDVVRTTLADESARPAGDARSADADL